MWFLPTAIKGYVGFVITLVVGMGGQVGPGQEKACPDCISENMWCKVLKLSRNIGWG